jgi:D-alanine-D-alanine ligase
MGKIGKTDHIGNVAVVCGGTTSEREVSLKSGKAVYSGLIEAGWEAELLDWPESDVVLRVDELRRYDVVFVGYHGGPGERGEVAAALGLAGIPFTGSGPTASAIAMDKLFTKRLFEQDGIPTPNWLGWDSQKEPSSDEILRRWRWGFPIVVKPSGEGSTVGITIAENEDELGAAISDAIKYDRKLLFEEYIPGRELTFAVIEGLDTPPVEIIPKKGFYDFEHKYTSGASEYICPAQVPSSVVSEIREVSERVFGLFGLRHYARADFRFDGEKIYCLEINSLPGMTSLSLVPMAAKAAGVGFSELVDRITRMALGEAPSRG